MIPENWIYPSSFDPCILTCHMDENRQIKSTLSIINRKETHVIKISFTGQLFEPNTTTIFECDLIEARNEVKHERATTKPFLFVTNIPQIKNVSLMHIRRGILFEFGKLLIEDPEFCDADDPENDYVLRVPPLFHMIEIRDVFKRILPNFYGKVCGVRFFKDVAYGNVAYGSVENATV